MNINSVFHGKTRAVVALLVFSFALTFNAHSQPHAQNLDTEELIDRLKPDQQSQSRSLRATQPKPVLTEEQKLFLQGLPGRGISIRFKRKIAKIIDDTDLPTVNIQIQFDYDSSKLKRAAMEHLDRLGKALSSPALHNARIMLNGHTDAIGSNDYNMELSEARANSVRIYLIEQFDIGPERLVAIGFGEERLLNLENPNSEENRRVEVVNISVE